MVCLVDRVSRAAGRLLCRVSGISPGDALEQHVHYPVRPDGAAVRAGILVGAVARILCRPDLKRTTWIGGVLFLGYYWIYLEGLEWLAPGYLARIWNTDALSGYAVSGKPVEELAFAWAFGMYWAGVYAHFTWRGPVIIGRS